MLFDAKAEFVVKVPSPEGPKKIAVRYPSDADWTEWRKKKKIEQRDLGRRSFQIESGRPSREDTELLAKILVVGEVGEDVEPAPAVDEAEAFYIIQMLAHAETLQAPERDGAGFKITIRAMRRLTTIHTLRIPTVRETMEFDRNRSSVTFEQFGVQKIRINFSAAGTLYDKLVQGTEGYVGGIVPVVHKAEAVNVLLQEIRAEHEDSDETEDADEG